MRWSTARRRRVLARAEREQAREIEAARQRLLRRAAQAGAGQPDAGQSGAGQSGAAEDLRLAA